jgi:hypothetical protein
MNVSHELHPDLFWALRGGDNNFCIFTTCDYETLHQGLMFTGKRHHNATHIPAFLDSFSDIVHGAEQDTQLAYFVAVAYYSGFQIASTLFEYPTPVDPGNPPAVVRENLAGPMLKDATQNTPLDYTTYVVTGSVPAGFRTRMWSQSFKLNAELIKHMSDHFFAVALNVLVIAPSVAFYAFPVPASRAMPKKGGKCIGFQS